MSVSYLSENADVSGWLNGVNVTLVENRWVIWDYNGTQNDVVALKVDMTDENGAEYTQYFSAGNPAHRQPSEDGKRLESLRDNIKGLPKNCQALKWFNSARDAGFPLKKLQMDDASVFDGCVVEVSQVPKKSLDGTPATRTYTDEKGEPHTVDRTDTVISAVISIPDDAGKQALAKKAKPETAATPQNVEATVEAEAEAEDKTESLDDIGTTAMVELLKGTPSIRKAQIVVPIFKYMKAEGKYDKATTQAVSRLCISDAFLNAKAKDGFWTYEDGIVKKA